MLSPKLEEYIKLGAKFEPKNDNSASQTKDPLTQVCYGKYEYNLFACLKDDSEDEEEQKDYEIEAITINYLGQYECVMQIEQIHLMVINLNKKL